MAYPYHMERFVTDYLASQGAVVERVDYGVQGAVLDGQLAVNLGTNFLMMAFDYDAFTETPGAEYISFGNRMFEKIVHSCVRNHVCTKRFVEGPDHPPRALEGKIAETLMIPQSRIEVQATKQYLLPCFRFTFKIAFLGDEREESLQRIWIDGVNAKIMPDYETGPHIFFSDEATRLLPQLPPKPLESLFEVALNGAREGSRIRGSELEQISSNELRMEIERTEAYFGSMIQDLEIKRSRAIFNSDAQGQSEVEAKLDAVNSQRSHHINDITAKYKVRCELELMDVVCYMLPRWRIRFVSTTHKNVLPDELWWDIHSKCFLR